MKTSIKLTVLLAGLALAVPVTSVQADESANSSSAKDTNSSSFASFFAPTVTPLTPQKFVNDSMAGHMKEVYLSEMAMDRCTNAEVQEFAGRMIRDHREANEKLMKIAKEEGLTCLSSNTFRPDDSNWNSPALVGEPAMKGQGAQMLITTNVPYYWDYRSIQMIKLLKDVQFRDAYITQMSDDHVAAINAYVAASQTLGDEKLKKYADKTLPMLRKQLEMSQHLKSVEFESAATNVLSQNQTRPYTYPMVP